VGFGWSIGVSLGSAGCQLLPGDDATSVQRPFLLPRAGTHDDGTERRLALLRAVITADLGPQDRTPAIRRPGSVLLLR
jgi:hypothetical protein